MHTPVKNVPISVQGFSGPKTAKMGNFEGVLVIGVKLKRHNYGRWESIRGLVDIPRCDLLYASFGGDVWLGRYEPPNTQFR